MCVDRSVMLFASFVILTSLILSYFVSPYWLLLTAFAGLNMMQASVTRVCPSATIFKKIGIKPRTIFK